MESELTSDDSLDSTTDKVPLLMRSEVIDEHRPKPIPSIVRRDALPPIKPIPVAPTQAKVAPTFTWPIAPAKPREPGTWKPPAPPARFVKAPEPAWQTPAPTARVNAIAKLELAPAPAAAAARVVETKPIAAEPLPIVVEPAPIVIEPAPIAIEPAPIAVEPAPIVIEATVTRSPRTRRDDAPTAAPAAREFGAGMLQARTRRAKQTASRDVSSMSIAQSGASTAPQFGAGMLKARRSRGKLVVVAIVLAAATVAGLYFAMGA